MPKKRRKRKRKRKKLTVQGAMDCFAQTSEDKLVKLLLEGEDLDKALTRSRLTGRAKIRGRLPE